MNAKFAIQLAFMIFGVCSTATADEGRMERIAQLINHELPENSAAAENCLEDIRVEVIGDGEVGHLTLAFRKREGGRSTMSRTSIQDVPPYSPERAAVTRELEYLKSSIHYRERFCARNNNPFRKPFEYKPLDLHQIIR